VHAPCFQVQLEATRPGRAHREANACAYHVPDVIETLRAWAGNHGVTDGQLTILAVEPAAGGRHPIRADEPDLRGFAFSRIPLNDRKRRGARSVQAGGPVPQRPGELGRE
jgi:hypothetical protein